MSTPVRFQLSRRAGYRMPPGGAAVTRASRWGNPHKVAEVGRAEAVRLFENDLLVGRLRISVADVRDHLAGRPLGCTCRLDEECHADVLLRIANAEDLDDGECPLPVRPEVAAVASPGMSGAERDLSGSAAADGGVW